MWQQEEAEAIYMGTACTGLSISNDINAYSKHKKKKEMQTEKRRKTSDVASQSLSVPRLCLVLVV
jgi:hypothetical protein